jgi:GMP reductase
MVHLDNDVKLDFKDVLIRPKRTSLSSRSQVSLDRTFTFKHSKHQWTGVPVIAANMDTVGTFAIARVLGSRRILTAVHKHYSVAQWRSGGEKNKLFCPSREKAPV